MTSFQQVESSTSITPSSILSKWWTRYHPFKKPNYRTKRWTSSRSQNMLSPTWSLEEQKMSSSSLSHCKMSTDSVISQNTPVLKPSSKTHSLMTICDSKIGNSHKSDTTRSLVSFMSHQKINHLTWKKSKTTNFTLKESTLRSTRRELSIKNLLTGQLSSITSSNAIILMMKLFPSGRKWPQLRKKRTRS